MKESHRFCTDLCIPNTSQKGLAHWAHFAFSYFIRFPTCVCFAEGLAQCDALTRAPWASPRGLQVPPAPQTSRPLSEGASPWAAPGPTPRLLSVRKDMPRRAPAHVDRCGARLPVKNVCNCLWCLQWEPSPSSWATAAATCRTTSPAVAALQEVGADTKIQTHTHAHSHRDSHSHVT